MEHPELFSETLRRSFPAAPKGLADQVLSRLGPPAVRLRQALVAGIASCLIGIFVAASIGRNVAKESVASAPPEFVLLTRGIPPLGSF